MKDCPRSTTALRGTALVVICASRFGLVLSHEVRPAYLQITELPNHHYDILWKQPSMGAMAVHLVPQISGSFLEQPPAAVESAAGFQIHLWRNCDAGAAGL